MLDQSISKKNLQNIVSSSWVKWGKSQDFELFYESICNKIDSKLDCDKYNFSDFSTFKLDDKKAYDFSTGEDEIVCKKLNDNIKRLFKIKTSDRHAIVKQVISLLNDTQPIKVIRLDIKDFYESINRNNVLNYVKNEWLLSHQNRCILDCWNKELERFGINGLPRGMSLSSTLSEIRMRPFDREVRKLKGIFYYARFVDDIIIVGTNDIEEILFSLRETLKNNAPELSFNDKTKTIELNDKNNNNSKLDYLGYEILVNNKINNKNKKSKRDIKVYISDKKIKKIKNRVRRSFSSYARTRNYRLLISRLKFLTGNQYIIGDIERTRLKSGIYYNYPLINDFSQIIELDLFYQKLITTKKGSVGKAIKYISDCDSKSQSNRFERIQQLSFKFGFEKRLMNSFNKKDCKNIKRCW